MRTIGSVRSVAVFATIIALVLIPCSRLSVAGSISDAGFGTRFTAAVSRVSRYADVSGMGGASAGSRLASSYNPAGSAWSPATGPKGFGVSGQYSGIFFDEGTVVHLGSLSAARGPSDLRLAASGPGAPGYEVPGQLEPTVSDYGIIQPSLLVLESNHATMSDGVGFEWNALYGEVQWARMLSDTVAIGANLNALNSQMKYDLDSTRVAESEGMTYGLRIGGLYQPSEQLYVGLALEYSINPSRTTSFDFMGLGIGTQKDRSTLQQFSVRPGVSWIATKDLTLNLDYQYGHFSEGSDKLDVHRFYVGGDLTVLEGVYLRAGAVIDTEGNFSPALGLGIAPSESVYIDIAWQKDLFPEIEEEFGKSNMISIGLTVLF